MGNATLADLARRAVPFLRDEGAKYEDDGSNEPLELAREIEAAIANKQADGCGACGDACEGRGACRLAKDSPALDGLLSAWSAEAADALPADAMLINKKIRELDDALAKQGSHAVAPRFSDITRQLIERDMRGRKKYGATLDRSDLSLVDWLQHMAEELMDAAGYALAAKRTAQADTNSEAAGLRQLAEAISTPDGYAVVEELPGIWGFRFTSDGVEMASVTSWNHPALAAMSAWENYCASGWRLPHA